jgi:hypothetical protein
MKLLGMIADHPTPKISGGGIAYTLNSRDYKGVMLIVAVERKNEDSNDQDSNRLADGKAKVI